MPYGIVYLPDESTATALIDYALQIAAAGEPVMTLGGSAPPHVTVLHVEGGREQADDWWTAVAPRIDAEVTVQVSGVLLESVAVGNRYVPTGGVVVGLELLRRDSLQSAHALAVDGARRGGLVPVSGAGENYRPHVSLTVLTGWPATRVPFDPDLATASFRCTPALGELGPFGTFPRILARRGD